MLGRLGRCGGLVCRFHCRRRRSRRCRLGRCRRRGCRIRRFRRCRGGLYRCRSGRGLHRFDRLGRRRHCPEWLRLPALRADGHLQQRGHAPGAVFRPDAHAVRQNVKLRLRQQRLAGQGVIHDPVHSRGRQNAGAAVIDRGGHGVNVRPRADAGVALILLDGAEALFGHHLGGLDVAVPSLNVQVLGRAKVKQNQPAVRPHHDIVRADVPMDNAMLVNFCQRLNDGRQQGQAGVEGHRPLPLQLFQQRLALDEVHDNVSRFILDENGLHSHNAGNAAQLRHFPGFFQEAVEALLGAGLSHHGVAPHHHGAVFPADHAGAHGEIFFDRDLLFQQKVKAYVGDAEAALPQHFAHQILSVQNRAGL